MDGFQLPLGLNSKSGDVQQEPTRAQDEAAFRKRRAGCLLVSITD